MQGTKSEKILKLDILFILAVFVVARISCPALSNIPFFSMAFTFVYGAIFVFLYLFTAKSMNRRDFSLMASAICYALYVFSRGFIAGSGTFARDQFNAYVIVFLTMIYIWVKDKPIKTKAFLFKLIFAALIFNYVYSIIVLFYDPGASRTSAATSVLEKSPFDILNAIGSFDAVYGGLSVILILLYMRQILKEKNVKNVLSLLVLVLSLVFVIMASYVTALVLLIVALALFVAQKNKLFSAALILLTFLIVLFHEPFGDWIMDVSSKITYSETVSEKLHEFGDMIKTFETSGTYAGEGGRAARMAWSWNTFMDYPLFGGIGIQGAKVGGHSELLDFPARFGLVGLVLLVTYFVCLYRNVRTELSSDKMRVCFKIILFVFVVSAVLNPSLYSLQMMPLILMMPLARSYIEMCENKKR